MINSNEKNYLNSIKFKKVSYGDDKRDIKKKIFQNKIFIIFLIFFIIIFIFFFYKLIEKLTNKNIFSQLYNFKAQNITDKKQIENVNIMSFDKEYLYDINFYCLNNIFSSEDLNKLNYFIIYHCHSIEKGLSHFKLRPFGSRVINSLIHLLKKGLKHPNYESQFSFIIGINSLREYQKAYNQNKWNYRMEYKKVSKFLKHYEKIKYLKTGTNILTKEELKKDYKINYKKFISSRHSIRNYKNLKLKTKDIIEALEMAKYSPSACNRQFIKVHYYPNGKMRQNIIDYSIGKSGFYLDGVNTFIITFDVNGLGLNDKGERNQGYLNAGLFATNLINAFHSIGIGTCLIGFNNPVIQEEKLKKINNIPSNERIAVMLYAGYYDDKSIVTISPRKNVKDIFTEHK